MTTRKLKQALAAYLAIGAAGYFVATDSRIRLTLWAVLAGLALKTVAAHKLGQMPPSGAGPEGESSEASLRGSGEASAKDPG